MEVTDIAGLRISRRRLNMEKTSVVRFGWLKAMYIYTIATAGGFGLAMLAFPGLLHSLFGVPIDNPTALKLCGSILLGAGLISIPALRFPLKFSALLLLQLVYKPIWIAVGALPFFFQGQFPLYIVMITVIFIGYIAGDLIAIPWGYLFSREKPAAAATSLRGGPAA
jgi:hypothetical protein